MLYHAYIFDFDYTLGDSTTGIILSANYALKQLGCMAATDESIQRTIGLSLKNTYISLTGCRDEEKAALFTRYFREKSDEIMTANTTLYPGTKDLLCELKEQGFLTGIVTTKFHYRIDQILRKYDASGLVDRIVGAEDVAFEKPSPEGLLYIIGELGIPANQTLYIGDSQVDAETAQRAGVDFAGVLTGTTGKEDFRHFPYIFIADNLNHLFSQLTKSREE